MPVFPVLKTGAVIQYPAQKAEDYSTQVVRFLDGSEQRTPDYGSPLHRWIIQLSLLDETELWNLRQFFLSQQGQADPFSFTDPWDSTVYASCSFEGDEMDLEFSGEGQTGTQLVVKENRA
jgi:phage-related protein